ncbi:hypothetical protein EGK50_09360, partial [Enterococcus faecium]
RCLFYMFWKIKKMLVSSTNIKKYRAIKGSCDKNLVTAPFFRINGVQKLTSTILRQIYVKM